ncbi:hypothetical protein [Lysobacter sp.]|uniref:hypothetical protein n=1 Tax=Lysobacter sp. TaxID=72226 RepID=UPI002D785267|nr:hypothetical protein [Lysobacter sp.]
MLMSALAACDASEHPGQATQPAIPKVESSPVNHSRDKEVQVASVIPETFQSYVSSRVGNDWVCEAGAVTDEDGLSQRPLAYLRDAGGRVKWVREMDLPADTFQARATGCIRDGNRLFVLLQADTQSSQTLSQTLLSVAALEVEDGAVTQVRDVVPPQVNGPYSAWVDDADSGFRVVDGNLSVSGHYFRMEDPENRRTFVSVVKIDQ